MSGYRRRTFVLAPANSDVLAERPAVDETLGDAVRRHGRLIGRLSALARNSTADGGSVAACRLHHPNLPVEVLLMNGKVRPRLCENVVP
jgi:hypothetical protein